MAQEDIPNSPASNSKPSVEDQEINLEDLCPICQTLLYRPVRTKCNHILCESCMAEWADISVISQMTTVCLDDEPMVLLPNEIETRCPMCRTLTAANFDSTVEESLLERYPEAYQARKTESQQGVGNHDDATIETLTLYIGNEHELIRSEGETKNKHSWKFFVRPSRTDLIEEVQVLLHPTFRNPRVILQFPPYEIRRLGWGFFTIFANIILRPGYRWMSSEAEDTRDGGRDGKLPLEWTLDFDGRGSQGRLRLKIAREKDGLEEEDVRQQNELRRLWDRQRQRDPDWGPG